MTNKEALTRLESLERDRPWLSAATKYSIHSLNNAFSGEERPLKERMEQAFERAFAEEERRREVDLTKPGASVWDLVFFNGAEVNTIDRAKKAGGYESLPEFYHDAVMDFADKLLEEEKRKKLAPLVALVSSEKSAGAGPFFIDLHGGVAAGSQISAQCDPEPIEVGKEYPKGHYALRVFGRSMEKEGDPNSIPDGSVILVKAVKSGGFPAPGRIVVYSDGLGSSLKVFGYRMAKTGEERNRNGQVPILTSLNPDFPDVQTIEGGKIDAVFVEILKSE